MLVRTATVVVAVAMCACASPCTDLRDHARGCGTAESAYVDPDDSVCATVRADLGEAFDDFAACVSESRCEDTQALNRCFAAHGPLEPDSCTTFRVWATGCGLEPRGTENECAALGATLSPNGDGSAFFDDWVACVVAEGCPVVADERYATCSEQVVPSGSFDLVDACLGLSEWGARCAEQAGGAPMGLDTTLPACLAQAGQFTTQSYVAYVQCVSALNCDDLVGRVVCLDNLTFIDVGSAVDTCDRLASFAGQCGAAVLGGTVDGCVQVLARASAATMASFEICVASLPCGDPAGLGCISLLEFL